MTLPALTLRIDERAILLSELVDNDCRTPADFDALRNAFLLAALDRENEVPHLVSNEPEITVLLPGAFTVEEIDPAPVSQAEAEMAATRLVAGLMHAALHPLKSVVTDDYGRLPRITLTESAQRLIGLELMSVWAPRAQGVRAAIRKLNLAAARRQTAEPKSRTRIAYTVRGSWPFPNTMLDHDLSAPVSVSDRALVHRFGGNQMVDRADNTRQVEIELATEGPSDGPDVARWQRHGWQVIKQGVYTTPNSTETR